MQGKRFFHHTVLYIIEYARGFKMHSGSVACFKVLLSSEWIAMVMSVASFCWQCGWKGEGWALNVKTPPASTTISWFATAVCALMWKVNIKAHTPSCELLTIFLSLLASPPPSIKDGFRMRNHLWRLTCRSRTCAHTRVRSSAFLQTLFQPAVPSSPPPPTALQVMLMAAFETGLCGIMLSTNRSWL